MLIRVLEKSLDILGNFMSVQVDRNKDNKTGTSQVGAISKAQKAQKIFFGKKLEIFEKKIFFGKCRIVPKKIERRDPLVPSGLVGNV